MPRNSAPPPAKKAKVATPASKSPKKAYYHDVDVSDTPFAGDDFSLRADAKAWSGGSLWVTKDKKPCISLSTRITRSFAPDQFREDTYSFSFKVDAVSESAIVDKLEAVDQWAHGLVWALGDMPEDAELYSICRAGYVNIRVNETQRKQIGESECEKLDAGADVKLQLYLRGIWRMDEVGKDKTPGYGVTLGLREVTVV